jgi:hypothetical protein
MPLNDLNQDSEQPVINSDDDGLEQTIRDAMEKSKPSSDVVAENKPDVEPAAPTADESPAEIKEDLAEAKPVAKHKAPEGYTPAFKEKWASLPDDIQAEISKREEDFHKMVTAKDGELNLGKEMKEVISPYMPIIQAEGGTPATAVRDLLNTAYVLRKGTPEQKLAVVQTVCEQYGIDLSAAMQEKEYVDPTISQLQQEINRLKTVANPDAMFKQLQERQERDNIQKEANAFASNPEHKYFEKVRPFMASFLGEGVAKDYKEAYDMACYAHPEIRSILESEKKAVEQEKRKSEVAAKLNAASSITGSPATNSVSNAVSPNEDLETTIRAAFRASSGKI